MKRQDILMLFFIPVLSACLESPTMTKGIVNGKEKPTVMTEFTNPILIEGNLFFQGKIIDKGKDEAIETGFYWSTDSARNLGMSDSDSMVIVDAYDENVFSYELKNASGEKTYYWRAFARNNFGFDYGKVDSCRTPQIWEEKESLNAISRGRGAVFVLNNKIYMTCGQLPSGSVLSNDTWEYSIANNRWGQLESFPGDYRRYPVAFTIGNLAFVGTGQKAAGVAYNDFFRYNSAASDSFWEKISTPDDLIARYEGVAFSINGKGYIVAGRSANNEILDDIWQYDPEDNSWQKKNDFPAKFYGGISICGNSRAFAGFGEPSGTKKILWEYDEKTDNWSVFTTLPDEVTKKIYSGVIVRNTIYIVDGNNTIWVYNMSNESKTWGKKADLPLVLLDNDGNGGEQLLISTGNSNSIYVGLGYTKILYEYRPLWDN